nr:deoxycytidine triphosphate deaminase [Methyloceanibacter sp. wino2]
MGSEAYVSPSEAEQDPKKITIQQIGRAGAFTIPPGQFAFLLTEEHIKIPQGAIGFISIKTRIKFRGLVNVSGFHVDPGYSGRLIFAVFNAGPRPIHLRRGDECFLMWLASLDDPNTKMIRDKDGFNSINTDLVSKISGPVMSFEGLNAKIGDLKKDYDKRIGTIELQNAIIKWAAMAIFAILIGVVVTPTIRGAWQDWSSPNDGALAPGQTSQAKDNKER